MPNGITNIPPFIKGLATAKTVALIAGISVFFVLMNEVDAVKRWALLFWYPTVAAVAVFTNLPELANINYVRLPGWLLSLLIGAWLNLVVVIFASDLMQNLSMVVHLSFGWLSSQYWFVVDGAIIALVASLIATVVQKRA